MGRVTSAAFLDRDGTLNVRPPDHEYVTSVDEFVWLPGAPEAVAQLGRAGYVITVVSNQRGVARGLVSVETIREIEDVIQRELAQTGARITAFRYCFHDVAERCECRKPRPGLLRQLGSELGLDLARSWTIGDSESDVLAGRAVGTRTALVGDAARRTASRPDVIAASLLDAAHAITTGFQEAPRPVRVAPGPAANSSTNA